MPKLEKLCCPQNIVGKPKLSYSDKLKLNYSAFCQNATRVQQEVDDKKESAESANVTVSCNSIGRPPNCWLL